MKGEKRNGKRERDVRAVGPDADDDELRKALLEDPVKAAASQGIELTEEQAAGLRSADLGQALEGLDERLSKFRLFY